MPRLKRTLYAGRHCDNIHVLRGLEPDSVDLIATDPPFNSKRSFNAPLESDAAGQRFDDRWKWEDVKAEWKMLFDEDEEHAGIKEVLEAAAVIEGGQIDRADARSDGGRDVITGLRGRNSVAAYLAYMAPRLIEMKRVLKPNGSIYIHCDGSADYLLRMLMDCVFGRSAFRNAITWKRTTGRSDGKRWGRVTDTILFYALGRKPTWNDQYTDHDPEYLRKFYRHEDQWGRWRSADLTAIGRTENGDSGKPWRGVDPGARGNHWRAPSAFPAHFPKPANWGELSTRQKLDKLDELGLVIWPKTSRGTMPSFKRYLSTTKGTKIGDFWPDPLPVQTHSKERSGWATQKPVALYERIIAASSNEGDVVLDPFAGCATTCVAAERLKRQWIGVDIDEKAKDVFELQLDAMTNLFNADALRRWEDAVKTSSPRQFGVPTETVLRKQIHREQNGRCAMAQHGCDAGELRIADMELDHVLPKSRGGEDHRRNRIGLCGDCNRRKGAMANSAFVKKLEHERLDRELLARETQPAKLRAMAHGGKAEVAVGIWKKFFRWLAE